MKGEGMYSISGQEKVSVPGKVLHLSPWLAKFMMGELPAPLKRRRKAMRMTLDDG